MSSGSPARAVFRLFIFSVGSWLVVAGAIIGVLSRFPERWKRSGPHVARWGRLGQRCLGIRVRRAGELPEAGSLVVANHYGYADVFAIGGLFPCVFAARHDMRSWPMFGALAALGGTIFINRQHRREGARGIARVTAAVLAGATVVAFPEGTSTDGSDMLPFRTGIFQAAVEAGACVVPVAVRYLELDGRPITEENLDVVAWFRGEGFLGHALRLASHRSVLAEVRFGEPLRPPYVNRKALAAAAENRVREIRCPPPREGAERGATA